MRFESAIDSINKSAPNEPENKHKPTAKIPHTDRGAHNFVLTVLIFLLRLMAKP